MITLVKLLLRWLFKLLFKIKIEGIKNYHAAGDRVLIAVNHSSLLDGILLYLFLPHRPTFAINTQIHKRWYFKPFYKFVDLFVLNPLNPHSLKSLIKFLKQDNKAVIFPEGRITTTGTLMKVYDGAGMVAAKSGATVLPIGIQGAQFSKLSSLKGLVKLSWFPRIKIIMHPPVSIVSPDSTSNSDHRTSAAQQMTDIMLDVSFKNIDINRTLFTSLLDGMRIHGGNSIVAEDINREPITFRQLIARSFILGKAITKETSPGESVGILLPNAIGNLVTLTGMQCYGRTPAMLNFTAGPQGLVTACETALVKVVYTSRVFIEKGELEGSIEALEKIVKIIYLEDLRGKISSFKKIAGLFKGYFPRIAYSVRANRIKPDTRAVILFTSGSEGIPKGVVLSHKNILANYAQVHSSVALNNKDTLLNFLPMFHSFGFTAGTILPILEGTKVFFYPTPLHYRIIPELCYDLGATVMFGTNTFLAAYAKYAHPADFQSLRYVVAGAEKLQDETRKIWYDKFGIRLLEGYGTTEASPVVSLNTPLYNKPQSVGRLSQGMDYYLEPVEGLDTGGRLFISGPNVMSGYLFHGNDGDIVPPQTDRGMGWYDTGDIVSIDDLNYITIQGRAKRFAKIGGEMVSLTRVEDLANATWPDKIHAAAIVPDKKKGEQIYLITEHENADRKELVKQAKKEGLTELAIPRKVITVKAVPILGTGKLDYAGVTKMAEETLKES